MTMDAPLIPFDVMVDGHADIWGRCQPMLEGAIGRLNGTHNAADVLAMINTGQLHLWPGEKACAITEIVQYPQRRACLVFLLGGKGGLSEAKEWGARGGALEQWAFGRWFCDWIQYQGRGGWSRSIEVDQFQQVGMRFR